MMRFGILSTTWQHCYDHSSAFKMEAQKINYNKINFNMIKINKRYTLNPQTFKDLAGSIKLVVTWHNQLHNKILC